jgi:hypothetical protein
VPAGPLLTIAAHHLLDAWERALGQPGPTRVVPLLTASTGTPAADILCWSIARRDAVLFELREALFGARAEAVQQCPGCEQELEFEVDLRQLRPAPRGDEPTSLEAFVDGHRVRYRPPNTADLEAVAVLDDAVGARDVLLERCIEFVTPGGPESRTSVSSEIARRLSESEADAEAWLSLVCPACRHAWQAPFDIAGFLWSEVDDWAWRTLRQVHRLARAYGWTEPDVLSLSPSRRQIYLDLLGE